MGVPPLRPAATTPAYLRPSARAREHRHRRALLLGLTGALLLSLTPVVGRHLIGAAHRPLTGIDHVGALCLVALHVLLAPVHAGFHILLPAGLAYALADRGRAWRRARAALAAVDGDVVVRGSALWTAARAAGLDPRRVRVVDGLPTPAFTAGWLFPTVYVARELADGPRRLSAPELAAVLAHEHAHVVRRDPLRFSTLRAVACTLFWIPGLRSLADDVADEAEIRADDAAAAVTDPLTLASALVALAAWRPAAAGLVELTSDYAVGFVRRDLLDRRVRRLAGEDTTPGSRVSRRALTGAAFALAVVWTAGIVDVHDLPPAAARATDPAHAAHCHHLRRSPWAHLFCRSDASGGWITPGGSDCPHRDGGPG